MEEYIATVKFKIKIKANSEEEAFHEAEEIDLPKNYINDSFDILELTVSNGKLRKNLINWIYEDHKLSLETLINDFSKVPDSNPILTPILTREKFIEYKGVKTGYLGAFTKKEEEFLKSIYSQFNRSLEIRTMRFIHTVVKNGLINFA